MTNYEEAKGLSNYACEVDWSAESERVKITLMQAQVLATLALVDEMRESMKAIVAAIKYTSR